MRTFCESPKDGLLRRVRPRVLLVLFGMALTACGGGGGGSDNPAPPPPPPPPPGANVPPLSTTVIDVTNGQQLGTTHWSNGDTSTGGQGQPVGTLECAASQPNTYHVHTHLSIFLNGQQLTV